MNTIYGSNTIDVSGGIVFATLYNSNKLKKICLLLIK